MDYFGMYRDIWNYHKKYIDKISFADDKLWNSIIQEASKLGKSMTTVSL